MVAVGFFFAPIAPLVALAAAVVFWISSWVYKYQLMFVFVSRTESGGVSSVYNSTRYAVSDIPSADVERRHQSFTRQCHPHAVHHGSQYVVDCDTRSRFLLTYSSAIGLQYTFKSLYWIATIPPILFILVFKAYIHRTFQTSFRYYIPSEQELQEAQVHSKRADASGNKLEKRFGHPSLHSELFTPMVHKNMTHLLAQVYSGKISNVQTKIGDIPGQKVDAVMAAGIKFAGIEEVCDRFHTAHIHLMYLISRSITLPTTPRCINVIVASLTGTHGPCRLSISLLWKDPSRADGRRLRRPNSTNM